MGILGIQALRMPFVARKIRNSQTLHGNILGVIWTKISFQKSRTVCFVRCSLPLAASACFAKTAKRTEVIFLKRINLRELYPDYYQTDIFVDIPEEVLAVIREETRAEAAAKRKRYRYRSQYSLDVGDGIEEATLRQLPNPETILDNYQQREALYAAIMSLPEKQAKRIYARFFLGMTINEIAQIEGVSKSRVSESIRTGLKKLKKFF